MYTVNSPFSSTNTTAPELSDFVTIEKLCSEYSWISEHQLRWVLRHRHHNDLELHVSKFGKFLLISRKGFAQWLSEQKG